jgi:tetratricopeptide (TPR) repeat protein/predicted Ser/Thr protein kinase
MIGQTISHYRVLEKLGAGGMGVVYKAQDTRLDRAVALKFLPENTVGDPQVLERFRREAQAASALNHPGICTIYDIGEQDRQPFIAMEFINGETLRQHVHGKALPVEEILDLGIQIADALDAAHTEGIVHRDIKPANVFVTKRGQAKVLDFGLAKLLHKGIGTGDETDPSSPKLTQEPLSVVGIISGTPSYMSPEQVRGDDLDTRTDVFSLGLLLYEMATGRQAFGGGTGGAIIEAILTKSPTPVRERNPEIPQGLQDIIHKTLQKDRNLRYQSAGEVCADLRRLRREFESGQTTVSAAPALPAASAPQPAWKQHWKWIAGGAVAGAIALALAGWLYNTRRAHALNETDTIVLADFTNKTGEPVFDDTLRQGLAAQLEQSPFLSLVSEQRVEQTLRQMGRPPDTKLSADVARELCQRTASKAYLSGSISSIGSQYVIGTSAVNCQTGDYLAQEQVTADSKEHVLKALSSASTKLRERLGESLKSIQKLDTPIEQATTPSLEALQAYSLGRKTMSAKGDYTDAVPSLRHAIRLDPKFAMAYASLGTCYHNLGEKELSAENTKQAYELRSHVSDWEKFYIESHYYDFVTGDLEKARQVYELWAQTYPRESVPPNNLGVIYQSLGQYDKMLTEFREASRLAPGEGLSYSNLMISYIYLNRLSEARATAEEALSKYPDALDLRLFLYELAFLKNDSDGMAKQAAWSTGKPGKENILLHFQADTAAYFGQLGKARELSRQAAASALRAGDKEVAAATEAGAALREAFFGNEGEARKWTTEALALANGRDVQFASALALAVAKDSERSHKLADDLSQHFPEDTIVLFNYLPTLRAQEALNRGEGEKAVETLKAVSPYELGVPGNTNFSTNLYPVFVRGEAYLMAHQGEQAAVEFQKVIDHPGVVVNAPIGALARLALARAYVMAGDAAKARAAYGDFLGLWKDADRGIPVLQQAQAEYGKLH